MRLQEIMQHLEPRVLLEKTQIPHGNARANCTLHSSVVGNFHEFQDIVIAYIAHHMEQTLGMAPPPEICLEK